MKIIRKWNHRLLFYVTVIFAFANAVMADSTGKVFTRQRMLEDLAKNYAIRGVMELSTNAANLDRAVQELVTTPSDENLVRAQDAWTNMYFTHKRYQMLSYGPVEDEAFWAANFYKRPYVVPIEDVVRSPRPIDSMMIERMGGTTKGFGAMECLLFKSLPPEAEKFMPVEHGRTNSGASLLLEGDYSERRRTYLREVSANLARHMQAAALDAQAEGFPTKFVAGGQDSINLLVNEFVVTLESGIVAPLQGYTNQLAMKRLRDIQIEGATSKLTLPGMTALADGLVDFYHGRNGLGLADYVERVNPGLNDRLEQQFKATAGAMAALPGPIETTAPAQREKLGAVLDEARKLEIMCKVDLASALGVTIMFSANDGD